MPAPTPIRIQYGPTGLLAEAAVAAGRQEGFERQQAIDLAVIQGELDRRAHMRDVDARLKRDLLIAKQRSQAANVPTATRVNTHTRSPLVSSLQPDALKQQFLDSYRGKLPPEELSALQVVVKDPNSDLSDIRSAVNQSLSRESGSVPSATMRAKQVYLDSLSPKLPQQEVAALTALVEDPNTPLSDLKTATNQAFSRLRSEQVSPTTVATLDVRKVDSEARDIEREIRTLESEIRESGFDPNGPASQFNPTVRDTGSELYELTFGRFNPLTSGGDPAGLAKMKRIAQLRSRLNELTSERQRILHGGATTPSIDPHSGVQPSVSELTDDELLRQLLGS